MRAEAAQQVLLKFTSVAGANAKTAALAPPLEKSLTSFFRRGLHTARH